MNLVASESQSVAAMQEGGYSLLLRKCELIRGKLSPRGDVFELSLKEAVQKFCQASADPRARANVLRARRGHFLGIRRNGNKLENFLIVNPTDDGNIRWLLKNIPELETSIIEVYMIDEVNRAKNASDLPTFGGEA